MILADLLIISIMSSVNYFTPTYQQVVEVEVLDLMAKLQICICVLLPVYLYLSHKHDSFHTPRHMGLFFCLSIAMWFQK